MKKIELKNSLCVLIETGIGPVAIITSKDQKHIFRLSGWEEFNYFVREYSLTIEEFTPAPASTLEVFEKFLIDNTALCYMLWNYSAYLKATKGEQNERGFQTHRRFVFEGESEYLETRHIIWCEFVFGYTAEDEESNSDELVYFSFKIDSF